MQATQETSAISELFSNSKFKANFSDGSEKITAIRWQRKGMFPSEVLAFCTLAKRLGLNRIFESGMAMGYSTEILTTLLKSPITSFDLAGYGLWRHWLTRIRLRKYKNLDIYRGNSKVMLPPMLEQSKGDDRVGLIIDGPKGLAAVELADTLARRFSQIRLIGIHDIGQGRDSEFRRLYQGLGWQGFATDDQQFRAHVGILDEQIITDSGFEEAIRKYPRGPGIGLCWID
jgi:hypothetical protein